MSASHSPSKILEGPEQINGHSSVLTFGLHVVCVWFVLQLAAAAVPAE